MYNNIPIDDFEAKYNVIDSAEKFTKKMLPRIKYENHTKNHFLYNSLIKESVDIFPVELPAYALGVEVFFSLKNKQLLQTDANDWLDLDCVCG